MKVSFCEEFPTDQNMSKLKLIKFPTKVFIAAHSYEEFKSITKKYAQENIEFAYWPIIPVRDGYWLSPFIPTNILKQTLKDASQSSCVVVDLEFPRNRFLLFNLIGFVTRKKMLHQFLRTHKNMYSAEYPTSWRLLVWLGMVSKKNVSHKYNVGKMVYSKIIPLDVTKLITALKREYGEALIVYLGCIASGVQGSEHILSPEGLRKDLEICKKAGVKEVCIFRVGGLNKDYLQAIMPVL